MGRQTLKIAVLAVYFLAILLANSLTERIGLVSIGFGLAVTAGTFAAGLVLVFRDFVQLYFGTRIVLTVIVLGALASAFTANPAIATASGIAFLGSELVDYAVFTRLSHKGLTRAILASSVVSAPIDTVLFLQIAGFPVTLETILGQFVVKVAIALLVIGGKNALSLRK